MLGPMIQEMLRLQLRHLMETEAVNATERAEGQRLPGARLVTIAFADLVGFTRLGEVVPPEDLERLAHRLADLAREVAVPPVRFIKTIGDEVMLVSSDPVALLDAVLDLVDATDGDDDFPRLRAGVATGMAVSRAGDWFGSPVNLASRVTGAARPGSVLVSESAREAIGDDDRFTWSFAGARRLKGIKSDVRAVPRAAGYSRKRLISNPSHSQAIAHRGACGKTPVVAQNRWPSPEPAEMGVAKCVCCCRRGGRAGTSNRWWDSRWSCGHSARRCGCARRRTSRSSWPVSTCRWLRPASRCARWSTARNRRRRRTRPGSRPSW